MPTPLSTRSCLEFLLILALTPLATAELVTDDFNNGSPNPSLWASVEGASVRGAGEAGFLDGHALWFGGGQNRIATTRAFNTLGGGTLRFSVRIGDGSYPWWDRLDYYDYAALAYQIPGRRGWYGLRYFYSYWWSGRFFDRYETWTSLEVPLPAHAQSQSTVFAFIQRAHNGLHRDHWAVDNFQIETTAAGATWSHPLPPEVRILKGRIDSTGSYRALLQATGPFGLGGFSGSSGIYLARTGLDGRWNLLTPLPSASTDAQYDDMAIDASDQVYLCGSFTAGHLGLPDASGSPDAFVAKFGSDHTLLWARRGINATSSEANYRGLCVGTSGEITVTGRFHNFVRFGPEGNIGEPELFSGVLDSSLLVRYDAAGNYQWSRRIGETADTDPHIVWGLRCDPSGNLYVHGRYAGTLTLVADTHSIGSPGPSGDTLGFLAKYNSTGGVQWLTNLGYSSEVRGVAVDGTDLYAAGLYSSTHFNPTGSPVAPDPSAGVFLARIDPVNGAASWARTASSAGDDLLTPGECLGLDQSGNAYLAHTFEGNSIVNGQATPADPGFNLMVSRWSDAGTLTWRKRAGEAGIDTMAVDSIGQVHLAGAATDLAAFESNAILADPAANYLHRFNNILEPTQPVGAYLLRSGIPANLPGDSSLGELIAKDSDFTGTYTFEIVDGQGDAHNSWFSMGGTENNELLLANGLRLVPGDLLSLRVRITDETGKRAESIIKLTVGPPVSNLWANSFGSTFIRDCVTGPDGSLFVAGFFIGTLEFGPWTVTSAGSADFFIAKTEADGTPAWILRGGSSGIDRALALDIDSAGNCHACGIVGGEFGISRNGPGDFAGVGPIVEYNDLWVASFRPDGYLNWLVTSGGPNAETPEGIVHDEANDRTYVTGNFFGSAEFDGYAIRTPGFGVTGPFTGPSQASLGANNAFVARYDGGGNLAWVRFATGSEYLFGKDVEIDSNGDLYTTGKFNGHGSFAGLNASTPDANTAFPSYDAFLWKILADGSNGWVRRGGGTNRDDEGLFVGIDGTDRITIAGRSNGHNGVTADFGALSLPISDGWDPILVTYDANGAVQSGHIFHSGFQDEVKGFEVFPSGSMMLAANVSEMDNVALSSPASFLQLDPAGTLLWSDALTPAFDCAAFAPDLAPHAAGSFSGSVEVAGEILTTGSTYAARLPGPVPSSQPPTSLSLGTPSPDPPQDEPEGGPPVTYDATVPENVPVGTVVAPLVATDPDSNSLVFQLIEGEGSDHNLAFAIDGTNLVTNSLLNFEERSSYLIRLRVIDEAAETLERAFVIGVEDLPDSIPATVTLTDLIHVYDGQAHGATASTTPFGVPLLLTYDGSETEPTTAGSYPLHAAVDHPDYSGNADELFWIRTALQQWMSGYFPDPVINDPAAEATTWGRGADPDVDDISNVFEAYFGTNPSIPDPRPDSLFEAYPLTSGGDYLLKWPRSKNPPAGTPTPQWSKDLVTWYKSGEGPTGDPRTFAITVETDLGDREAVRATLPASNDDSIFMRLAFP